MAKYSIATSDPLTKKIWEEKLHREIALEESFSRMKGVVYEKTELEKSKGDAITFGFSDRLSGAGRTNDEQLEGYEERLSTYDDTVSLSLYRHAVRDEGELHRKRPAFSVTEEQREHLKVWGMEKIESLKHDAAVSTCTNVVQNDATNVLVSQANEAAAKSALASADVITPQFVSQLRRYARNGGDLSGASRNFDPIEPLRIEGKDYYVAYVNDEVIVDMQSDTTFSNAWQNARERNSDNPLFRAADVIWDGVIFISNERHTTFDDGGGAAVHGTKGVLLGKNAIACAWGKRVNMVERDFDYGDEMGVALKFILGIKALEKNSVSYGRLAFYTASTKIG